MKFRKFFLDGIRALFFCVEIKFHTQTCSASNIFHFISLSVRLSYSLKRIVNRLSESLFQCWDRKQKSTQQAPREIIKSQSRKCRKWIFIIQFVAQRDPWRSSSASQHVHYESDLAVHAKSRQCKQVYRTESRHATFSKATKLHSCQLLLQKVLYFSIELIFLDSSSFLSAADELSNFFS